MVDTNTGQKGPSDELVAKTVWPTIGAYPLGRVVGQLGSVSLGIGSFFTLGKLLALASIPIALVVYAWQLMPIVCRRYTLTSHRILILNGLSAVEEKSLDLDGFDTIDVELLPGQDWLHAGDLVFKQDANEVFRLPGVSRPEVFRQVCLKSQHALLSVRQVLEQQPA